MQSLIILRPLAILLLGYGMIRLTAAQIAAHRFLFGLALAIGILLLLHLIPLPPSWWQALPGRELIVRIDQEAGLGNIWRPISLAPDAARNALYAALVPAAVLVLGAQLNRNECQQLLGLVLLLGGISAILGLAQIVAGQGSVLRFYRVTNDAYAVGLFANRNHQALLLAALVPMLAVWAADRTGGKHLVGARTVLALGAGAALLPFILVTGSRAGLILAGVAFILVPFVLTLQGKGLSIRQRALPFAVGIVLLFGSLALLTIWLGKGTAWDRLLATAPADDLRFAIVPSLILMIRTYLPLGSGFGSFESVYKVHEPDALLEAAYMHQAHNDWLDLALTGGIPALLLLLVAVTAYLLRARTLLARSIPASPELRLARLGFVVVLLAALASLVDYPLRVPSLACLFVVALLWMCCPLPKNQPIELPS